VTGDCFMQANKKRSLLRAILWAGLLVGTLDIASAFISFSINSPGRNPLRILHYIASAVFEKDIAYSENYMLFVGLLCHYIIAYCFTILFMLIYPKINLLSKSRLLTGIIYGVIVWCIMNLLIVPNTRINRYPAWNRQAMIQMGILMIAIGIPLSYIAYNFYKGRAIRAAPIR
jgi:uncharacterized membrane protein YagU involved in acid resistance